MAGGSSECWSGVLLIACGRILLKDIFSREDQGKGLIGDEITIAGWVRTGRDAEKGALAFLAVSDGTCPNILQVIVSSDIYNLKEILPSGTSISVTGNLVESPGKGQSVELKATKVNFVGTCDAATFPLAPKAHTLEYLRSVAHLRPRSNLVSPSFALNILKLTSYSSPPSSGSETLWPMPLTSSTKRETSSTTIHPLSQPATARVQGRCSRSALCSLPRVPL